MYVPVYRPGAPLNSSAKRWEALSGFVYSAYRVTDLMQAVLDGRDLQIDFALYTGAIASLNRRFSSAIRDLSRQINLHAQSSWSCLASHLL